jgi:hypothetical protein
MREHINAEIDGDTQREMERGDKCHLALCYRVTSSSEDMLHCCALLQYFFPHLLEQDHLLLLPFLNLISSHLDLHLHHPSIWSQEIHHPSLAYTSERVRVHARCVVSREVHPHSQSIRKKAPTPASFPPRVLFGVEKSPVAAPSSRMGDGRASAQYIPPN